MPLQRQSRLTLVKQERKKPMELISEKALLAIYHKLESIALNESSPDLDYADFHQDMGPLLDVINNIARSLAEINILAGNLSEGKLSDLNLSKTNYLSGHFKELHSKLTHLTWQAKQIQEGNYDQQLEYFGDLSQSVNAMVKQLAQRETDLKKQVKLTEQKSENFKKLVSSMETVLDTVTDKVYVVDPQTEKYHYMNKTAKRHVQETGFYKLCYANCHFSDKIKHDCHGTVDGTTEYYCQVTDKWYELTSTPITWANEKVSVIYLEKDITDNKDRHYLEQIAYYDTATGAYNRRYAFDTLNKFFKEKTPIAVLFIDLDNLKGINDTHGHAAGDEYISLVYTTFVQSTDKAGCVCRIGGDEFVGILKNVNPGSGVAEQIAEKMHAKLQEMNVNRKYAYEYSVSVGIAYSDYCTYDTVDKLMDVADSRMYENKKQKKATGDRAAKTRQFTR
jgi:diguanylate cyclase (GGDEF)-like protein